LDIDGSLFHGICEKADQRKFWYSIIVRQKFVQEIIISRCGGVFKIYCAFYQVSEFVSSQKSSIVFIARFSFLMLLILPREQT
jgi:hypothetical protein